MTQDEFSRAFKGSPMKRAKLCGLKRNAAVVLGNIANPEDADVLARAIDDRADPARARGVGPRADSTILNVGRGR